MEELRFEELGRIRETAEDILQLIQGIARESLKRGKKPELPERFLSLIDSVIDDVLNDPQQRNKLIGVLPRYRQEFKAFLIKALSDLASEFKRQKILVDSIFDIKTQEDEDRLRLLVEMMIINVQEVAYAISKKMPIPQNIFENAKNIARFHNYEFINNFLNNDEYVAKELNISVEEVKESFPQGMRLRFAAHNISNPLEALRKVKEHLEITLSDENIAKELGMPVEEVRESFPRWMRLHFAAHNISNPLEALKRVKEHLDTILSDENIAKELGMSIEEVRESFPRSLRLYLAVGYISNPLETLKRVKEHLDTTLSDENIAKELGMSIEEVRESFPRWMRLRFAVDYISNPLEALKRVKEHLDTTLSDENIAKELGMSIEEVRESFPRWMRLRFAVHNISNPLEALKRVKEHLERTLSDENIARELGMSIEEVRESFPRGMRLHFAAYNISNPLEALKRVKEHLDTILSDENIAKELGMSIEEVRESFPRSLRLYLAVGYISNPLETLKRVKEHLDTILSDENIAKELGMSIEEVRESFPRWMRLRFAVDYISNPLEALKRVKEHLDTTLSDENIAKELGMSIEEVRESFPRWMRLRFAVHNISNPLEALKRVKEHLERTLSDENIARELGMSIEEVRESFPRGMRLHFAAYNISNPLEALKRVKEHLDTILSDENIAKELGMSIEEVRESFPRSLRLYLAVGYISNPLETLKRVKEHLDTILSDENIAKELGISLEEVKKILPKARKLYFAAHHIRNPLKGIKDWWEGKIKTPFKRL